MRQWDPGNICSWGTVELNNYTVIPTLRWSAIKINNTWYREEVRYEYINWDEVYRMDESIIVRKLLDDYYES